MMMMMMAEAKEIDAAAEDMVCIGTIGHVDHGKTSLTSAITRVLGSYMSYDSIDDGQEEKARGITIVAKHVLYRTKNRTYTHVDCPGHADYIKNMIVGSSQLDIAILVVSLNDGVMKQTTEHLNLISSIGVPSLIIFFNKADMVEDPEQIEVVIVETMEKVAKYKYTNVPYVIGSAVIAKDDETSKFNAEGKLVDNQGNLIPDNDKRQLGLPKVKELMEKVDQLAIRERDITKPFRVNIEAVHTIPGRGTVTSGRVQRGMLYEGEEAELFDPYDKDGKSRLVTVTSIQIYNKSASHAKPGHDAAFLLRGIAKSTVHRGATLAKPGSLKQHNTFGAIMYVNSKEEQGRATGFRKSYKPQFYIGSADITGTFRSFSQDAEIVNPGEWIETIISLEKRIPIEIGDKFIIRESGITVAVGQITILDPQIPQ